MKFSNLTTLFSTLCLGGALLVSTNSAHATEYVWTGNTSGKAADWFSPKNWAAEGAPAALKAKNGKVGSANAEPGGVPGPNDSATIGAGANVAINSSLTIGELTVEDGGILQGSGTVSVVSNLVIHGAKLQGTGSVEVGENGTMKLEEDESADNFIAKPIDCKGDIIWNSGDVTVQKDIRSRGTFYIGCDGEMSIPTGVAVPTFRNEGTLVKAISVGQTAVESKFVNSGDIYVRSGMLNLGTDFVQTSGSLNLDGGDFATEGTLEVQGGVVQGIGRLDCSVVNDGGIMNPGHSPGYITIMGNYTQTANGTLKMEIGGVDAGYTYDQMNVYGSATLDGKLEIAKWNNFIPSEGNGFYLITCYSMSYNFATFSGLYPGNNLFYDISQTSSDYMAYVRSDTSGPALNMTQPLQSTNYNALPFAKGTANDSLVGCGVNKVTLRLYRAANGSTPAGYWAGGSSWTTGYTAAANEFKCNGTTSWSLALPSLVNGAYFIRATAVDNMGNSSSTGNVVFNKVSSGGTTATIKVNPSASSTQVARLFEDEK